LQTFEHFDTRELNEAKNMVEEELKVVLTSYGELSDDVFVSAWESCYHDLMYIPQNKKFGLVSQLKSDEIIVNSTQHFYEQTITETKKLSKKVQLTEKRAHTLLGGFIKISNAKEKEIDALNLQLEQLESDLECFKDLQEAEDKTIVKRLEDLTVSVKRQREQEKELQEKFASLVQEKERLLNEHNQMMEKEKEESRKEEENIIAENDDQSIKIDELVESVM